MTTGAPRHFIKTPAIWQANLEEASVNVQTKNTMKNAQLVGGIFMDFNEANSKWVRN
jgi:hypothetical protein